MFCHDIGTGRRRRSECNKIEEGGLDHVGVWQNIVWTLVIPVSQIKRGFAERSSRSNLYLLKAFLVLRRARIAA